MKTTEKARELAKQFLNEQIDEEEYERGMLQLIARGYLKEIGLELLQAQFDYTRQQQRQTETQL